MGRSFEGALVWGILQHLCDGVDGFLAGSICTWSAGMPHSSVRADDVATNATCSGTGTAPVGGVGGHTLGIEWAG